MMDCGRYHVVHDIQYVTVGNRRLRSSGVFFLDDNYVVGNREYVDMDIFGSSHPSTWSTWSQIC
jgi:hypothetical protein